VTAALAVRRDPPSRRRTMVLASLGNGLEWYDWSVYAAFAGSLGHAAFPAASNATALLDALAVFAVGFVFRPLGGLLLGSLADRRGRRAALVLSAALMAGGSLVLALLPTHEQAGWFAPALLVLARSLQGLSVGGEITAMSTYVVEVAPRERRGLYSSVIYASTTLGTLTGTLVALFLHQVLTGPQLTAWGWRLPFAFGTVIALYAWLVRRTLPESPAFARVPGAGSGAQGHPALVLWRRHRPAVRGVVGITAGATLVYYTFAVYLPVLAQHAYSVAPGPALVAALVAQLVFVAALPLAGLLSDRYGRRASLTTFGLGFAVFAPVAFLLLDGSAWSLAAVMTAALLLFAPCAVAAAPTMVEIVPTQVRSSLIGLPYSLTVALFGGTAPYVLQLLTFHGWQSWFRGYVCAVCLVTVVSVRLLPETKGTDLGHGTAAAGAGDRSTTAA